MNDEHDLPRLPSDIRALIDADCQPAAMPRDARDRVLRNLGTALVVSGAATAATVGVAKASGGVVAGLMRVFTSKVGIAATAFALGGAAGAGGYAMRENARNSARAEQPAKAAVVVSAAPTMVTATKAPSESPAAPSVSIAPRPTVHSPSASPGPSSEKLASERVLVTMAANALARGDAANALEATGRHAKEFPHGQLVEEREFIAIRALLAAGRAAEAKTRATAFEKRFPDSPLLGSVQQLAGTKP